jgi:adenylate kinase family enzyme
VRLAAAAGLPLVHLDRLAWKAGAEADREELLDAHRELIAGERWVFDGNHTHVGKAERIARADLVVVLERRRLVCLWRVLRRRLLHHGQTRTDMAPGCAERLDLAFLRFIWRWHRRHPRYGQEIARQAGTTPVVVLRSQAEVERFAARFAAAAARPVRPRS